MHELALMNTRCAPAADFGAGAASSLLQLCAAVDFNRCEATRPEDRTTILTEVSSAPRLKLELASVP